MTNTQRARKFCHGELLGMGGQLVGRYNGDLGTLEFWLIGGELIFLRVGLQDGGISIFREVPGETVEEILAGFSGIAAGSEAVNEAT